MATSTAQDGGGLSGEGTTILIVVGTGGFTHAAPMLEVGRILAARGHRIEFATHHGQERWVESDPSRYGFVSRVHLMGEPMSAAAEVEHYMQMQEGDARIDFRASAAPKLRVDAFWESDYASLIDIVTSGCDHRPDLILSDFFVDMACRDIQRQLDIPLATMWPQMPYGMLGASYIPGPPGLQIDALTSEHASMWTRIRAALRPFRALPVMLTYFNFLRTMRRRAGVTYLLPFTSKPNHLVLINSFWGLETPRDLPPLAAPVGPILADSYPGLGEGLQRFLDQRQRVLYVSFGTHVQVQYRDLKKIVAALSTLLLPGEAADRRHDEERYGGVDVEAGNIGKGKGKRHARAKNRRRVSKRGFRELDYEMVYRESRHLLASLLEPTSTSSSSPQGVIDGVVWAVPPRQLQHFRHPASLISTSATTTTMTTTAARHSPPADDDENNDDEAALIDAILSGAHPAWHMVPFAPQRAVLAHPTTRLFLTHGGASSVQESLFHGTPMLCLGYFFDQPLNGLRITEAGVGESLDKAAFEAGEIVDKAERIMLDVDGCYGRNVERMRCIARVASRRKELAADLVQEVLFDHKYGGAVPPDPVVATTGADEDSEANGTDDPAGDLEAGHGPSAAPESSARGSTTKETSYGTMTGMQRKQQQQSNKYFPLGRTIAGRSGRKARPMHLQTADMRMPIWRARNWDLMFVGFAAVAAVGGAGWFVWLRWGDTMVWPQQQQALL
ncbi:glucuronosyltransferase [Microdochium nivale]|nr:glucuronosyltransferase [Microdochium nivale]